MRKFYNILLIILIIVAIVIGAMLIYKYSKEAKNEEQIDSIITELEKSIEEKDLEENSDEVEMLYKGYKIVGIIEIPKINIKYPILERTSEESMKVSVTKFWGPEVNEIGNLTIAGHNNFSGTMFGKTKNLKNGDIIKLTDLKNNTLEYKIFDKYSVDPDDISYVKSIEQGTREVTLITCTNGHKERLIIKARE